MKEMEDVRSSKYKKDMTKKIKADLVGNRDE